MEENDDKNKYDSVVPQSIEASGNFLKNANKKFIIILALICSLTFLGYVLIQKMEEIPYCETK